MDLRRDALGIERCKHGSSNERGVLDFSTNINPLGCSKQVIEALANVDRDVISKYPDDSYPELKNMIAKKERVKNENISLGNGSIELVYLFCYLMVDRETTVKILSPTFSEYEKTCKLFGGITRDHSGSRSKADVTFICNPNNPTSKLWGDDVIEKEKEMSDFLFLDETFMEFVKGPYREHSDLENCLTIKSFTKLYGLAGLRIGYGIGDKGLIDRIEKVRPPWNVNSLAVMAAIEALKDKEHIEKALSMIEVEKKYLFKELTALSLATEMPDTNFFFVKVKSASKLENDLMAKKISIRNCSSFTGMDKKDSYVRIAIKKHDENEMLISALRSLGGHGPYNI